MTHDPSRIVLGVTDIDEKYEVFEKLAEGGMGEIYRARHRLLDEVRVIKTVRPQYRDDPELRERFLREARVATQLHHSNIARIHDLSVGEDGTACIVMEYVHGVNLADRMGHEPPLEQHEVLELVGQTLDALGYLHQRKIVHRDISPDNIMLARDPEGRAQVKLIDLGIAKPLEGAGFQTQTAMFIGKVRYASPEQLGGGQAPAGTKPPAIDGRSDLYSLGVVLFELLTGQSPIRGTDEASVLAGHLFHPPRDFDEVDPQGRVSQPLRDVLMRSLEKAPDDRFQNAKEFFSALQRVASDRAYEGAAEGAIAQTLIRTPTSLASAPPAPDDPTVLATAQQTTAEQPERRATPGVGALRGAVEATAAAVRARRPLAVSLAALLALVILVGSGYYIWALDGDGEPQQDPLADIDFGTYKALVVGNDDYAYMPDLETATRDARDVAQLLEDRYGFQVTLLLNANRSELVNALYALTAEAEPTDNLMVYYAGHGSLTGPGGGGAWLPVDAQPMEDTNWVHTSYDVNLALEQSNARHILVIADSCYSSSLGTSPLARSSDAEETLTRPSRDQVLADLGKRARLIMAAGELKPIPDSSGGRHSIFTGALLDILDSNRDLLSVASLYAQVTPRVFEASEQIGAPQRPQLGTLDGAPIDESAFYFLPSQEEQAATATT